LEGLHLSWAFDASVRASYCGHAFFLGGLCRARFLVFCRPGVPSLSNVSRGSFLRWPAAFAGFINSTSAVVPLYPAPMRSPDRYMPIPLGLLSGERVSLFVRCAVTFSPAQSRSPSRNGPAPNRILTIKGFLPSRGHGHASLIGKLFLAFLGSFILPSSWLPPSTGHARGRIDGLPLLLGEARRFPDGLFFFPEKPRLPVLSQYPPPTDFFFSNVEVSRMRRQVSLCASPAFVLN